MAAKKASLLSEMHLRNLRQMMQLKQRTEEVVRKLEVQNRSSMSFDLLAFWKFVC